MTFNARFSCRLETALFLAVLGACHRAATAAITTVAMIPKASADIFWQSVHAGAVKSSMDHQVRIVWDGPPNETDIATEMQIVETMINRHVDAIALAPSDRSAFKIVVERAAKAGIPVVIYDSALIRRTTERLLQLTIILEAKWVRIGWEGC